MDSDSPEWLPEQLIPAALRLVRADRLAYELGETVALWSKDSPYRLVEERRGKDYQVYVESIRPPPPLASLLFSEAINHARAALDNVVWHLVEEAQGSVPQAAERSLAFPIHDTQASFTTWQTGMVKKGVNSVAAGTDLAQRIEAIQPFTETRIIASATPFLATYTASRVEEANPLKLLQGYSNTDKHRSIRMAMARQRIEDPTGPLAPAGFDEVKVGVPFIRGLVGDNKPMDSSAALLIERPDPYGAFVPPATELSRLVAYCTDVALPVLCTGSEHVGGIGRGGELGDSTASWRDRVAPDGLAPAGVSLRVRMKQMVAAAWTVPWATPEMREVEAFTGGDWAPSN